MEKKPVSAISRQQVMGCIHGLRFDKKFLKDVFKLKTMFFNKKIMFKKKFYFIISVYIQGPPNLWQHNFILKFNIFNFML